MRGTRTSTSTSTVTLFLFICTVRIRFTQCNKKYSYEYDDFPFIAASLYVSDLPNVSKSTTIPWVLGSRILVSYRTRTSTGADAGRRNQVLYRTV